MSTAAAEPAPPVPTASGSAPSLLVGSLLGALLVLAGFVAAGLSAAAVPDTTPYLGVVRVCVYLALAAAGVFVGGFLAGRNPAPGVSGGIILTVAVVVATAFIAAAFAANFKDVTGMVLAAVVLAGGGFGVFRLLTTRTGTGWCRMIDEQGWAGFHSHKRSQGLLVRRLTMFGVLMLGVTGAWSLHTAKLFDGKKKPTETVARTAAADPAAPASTTDTQQAESLPLDYRVPFTDKVLPLVPVADLTLPLLIVLLTVWGAWRAVNVPTFGDFLIATEAEMNKVSWTTRKQLIKDTLVVLVFLALLTGFLLVIDTFWSWLLSLEFIGVLPNKAKSAADAATNGKLPW